MPPNHHRHFYVSLFAALLIVCLTLSDAWGQKPGTDTLAVNSGPIDTSVKDHFFQMQSAANVLVDPGYRIWGLSVVRWTDGKYHAYYARWPQDTEHRGWMTDCEIAHAVADRPEGPFKTTGVVLTSRNPTGWDVVNAHNPYAVVANGKIHLYYIANNLRGKYPTEDDQSLPTEEWLIKNRDTVRASQCIGVATATDPAGPFTRAKNIVVQPNDRFKNIAVNPAVVHRDGQFVMVMKGDDIHKPGIFRTQFVGHADHAQGPFTFQEQPVFDATQSEDAALWFDEQAQRYYMVCHIMGKRDLALCTSIDSLRWELAHHPVLLKKQIHLSDGTVWEPHRVERPFVLTNKQGKPVMVYLAVSDNDVNGNIAIPLSASSN